MTQENSFWAHPTAIVDAGAQIAAGTKIWHFSHICGQEVHIGENCSFGQNTYVGPRVRIGRGCRIQNNVSLYDLVELEDYVFCGPSAVFTNVINPRAHISRKMEFQKTRVGRGASLGANCTVVCGVKIGRFAFVAAGAVVTRDVPEFALMVGVPAQRKGWICHCGVSLSSQGAVQCAACSSTYHIEGEHCRAVQLSGCFEDK